MLKVAEEYQYSGTHADASHKYLLPVIYDLIDSRFTDDTIMLDMGCGNGSMLAQFAGRNWCLIGTDVSDSGIRIAQHSYQDFENMKFVRSDITDTTKPLPEELAYLVGKIDLVLSTEVIEHVYNPKGFVANAYRMLRPGGQLIISTPYHGYLKNLMLAVTGQMDKHFTVLWDHGHIKFWSRKTICKVLADTGFEAVRFEGSGRLPYLWKSMVLSCYKPAVS